MISKSNSNIQKYLSLREGLDSCHPSGHQLKAAWVKHYQVRVATNLKWDQSCSFNSSQKKPIVRNENSHLQTSLLCLQPKNGRRSEQKLFGQTGFKFRLGFQKKKGLEKMDQIMGGFKGKMRRQSIEKINHQQLTSRRQLPRLRLCCSQIGGEAWQVAGGDFGKCQVEIRSKWQVEIFRLEWFRSAFFLFF